MNGKNIFSKSDFPLGAALTCSLVKVPYEIGNKTSFPVTDVLSLNLSHTISRHVARLHTESSLYPSGIINRSQVDGWMSLANSPVHSDATYFLISQISDALELNSYLVGDSLTIADLEVFAALYKKAVSLDSVSSSVKNWYKLIESKVQEFLNNFPKSVTPKAEKVQAKAKSSDGGTFATLPNAEKGKVVVRFPPEASGYLHIGHAKAALLNQYYQKEYQGKLIMRFDDTNPAKEDAEFEKVILEDIKLLEIVPDMFTHTSDLFPQMLELCEKLIRDGFAYADDTDAETMKKEREEKRANVNRDNTLASNILMWKDMKSGSKYGQKCCIRAKINMESTNGCLRDPTIYRCKVETHIRTGDKYKAYPTYDFACPIVDSVEGVTHALRTTEYHDRDDQYHWFIEKLGLRPVCIYDYSRLCMNNTVLSKRKLAWFVQQDHVDGWDDPRFPTVRGILRRGMTVEGLKEFIISQGSSKSVVNMEWDKIWAINKKVVDKSSIRYTALEGDLVEVIVDGATEELKDVPNHPKDPEKGTKKMWLSKKIFIEAVDAKELKEGENATFINWGNLMIKKINIENGVIKSVNAETNLSNTDYKKTVKLTWLAETEQSPWLPLVCVYFDHLVSKGVLGKDEDFKSFVNPNTRRETRMQGEIAMKDLKAGEIIQLQRKGFFRVDEEYGDFSLATCTEKPIVLFYIPDGHSKEQKAPVATGKNIKNPKEKSKSNKGEAKENNSPVVEKSKKDSKNKEKSPKPKENEDVKIVKNCDIEQSPVPSNKEQEKNEKNVQKKKAQSPKPVLIEEKQSNPSDKESSKNNNSNTGESKKKKQKQNEQKKQDSESKKQTRLCIEVLKEENFADWYSQVITKSGMLGYYDVSGCYFLFEWSFSMWEEIRFFFSKEIKKLGVKTEYYPLFVSKEALEKEQNHIEDFSPEVAWVTKCGNSDMSEPVAVRPTSETIVGPMLAKRIKSHRDLPLKVNQWSNVVRWEFKQPTPFIRSREFLWQEGHTSFVTKEEAEEEVLVILELYAKIYEDLLAVPVTRGRKTDKEKFAGAVYTTTVEAFVSANGKAIQAATSHFLGQQFSKINNICFEDPETKESKFVYQNSWGITTRSLGVMVMVHGDNKGAVLPPRVARVQAIIIPVGITAKIKPEEKENLYSYCKQVEEELVKNNIRAECDSSDHVTPGWKFNHWELKGVPIRLEVGPKEMAANKVSAVKRHNGSRQDISRDSIAINVQKVLDEIHDKMLEKAKNEKKEKTAYVKNWDDFVSNFQQKKLLLAPFCGNDECETEIRGKTEIRDNTTSNESVDPVVPSMGAKSLCIPFDQPVYDKIDGLHCINPKCSKAPFSFTLFGRSY